MKRTILKTISAGCAALLICACAQKPKQEEPAPGETVLIRVNTEGLGQIAVSDNGEVPGFGPEPWQSHVSNVTPGTELIIAAQADDGWKFVKWTKDGADYSSEDTIAIKADADTEYIAVFMMDSGWEGEPVSDVKDVKIIGDVLALPSTGNAYGETNFVYAFELNGSTYQAIADLDPETSKALFALDFSDPEYNQKFNELAAPLPVKQVINLTEKVPSNSEIQNYVGKKFEELIEEGFYISGWNLEENIAYLGKRYFSYEAGFEGSHDETFDEEQLLKLPVTSITCTGIGDAAYFEAE